MSDKNNILPITVCSDVLATVARLVRVARQHRQWTIKDLSERSGVPESTISRFERTGLASTDTLFEILFALNELECANDCFVAMLKRNELPRSLKDVPVQPKSVLRVRHGKDRHS